MPKQRNTGKHRGEPARVGDRQAGGEVWVSESTSRPGHVTVGVAHLGGMAVDLSRRAAQDLYHGLGRLLGIE